MKTTKTLGILIFLAVALAILPMVSATISMNLPGVGSNQSTNFVTNWSFVNGTDGVTDPISANSTFYWNATGSWVSVTKSGFVCTDNGCSATLTISSMGEGIGSLNWTMGNNTFVNKTGAISSAFRVDTTSPTASITATQSKIYKYQPVDITWSASDGGSGLANSTITITSPNTALCATKTYTTSSQTLQLKEIDTSCVGTYTALISTTDYASHTTTASDTFEVQLVGKSSAQNVSSGTGSNNTLVYVILGGAVLYYLFGRKK